MAQDGRRSLPREGRVIEAWRHPLLDRFKCIIPEDERFLKVLSPREARHKIGNLDPGESFCYYLGFILKDRQFDKTVKKLGDYMLKQGTPKNFLIGKELVVSGKNKGHLTQRRVGEELFEYIFTKIGKKALI